MDNQKTIDLISLTIDQEAYIIQGLNEEFWREWKLLYNFKGALYKRSQDPKGYLNTSCSKEETKMNLTSFDISYQR
jgi:hypothetical protein